MTSLLIKLNKGKGILVLLYWMGSSIATVIVIAFLGRNMGGIFLKFNFYSTEGIAFLITSLWTYATKDDYYKDKEGNKKKLDTFNSFAFIRMKVWSFIFLALGLIFLGNLLFHYFPKPAF